MPQFAPASTYAQQFGVKMVCYGPPGSGKTPLLNTAPRPVLLAVEPGLLSMRGSTIPTCMAQTPEQIIDFFEWLEKSPEARNYDTVGIDSASQIAEIFLERELNRKSKSGNKVDGKAAYGEMARLAFERLNTLYWLREKHIYIICKQDNSEAQKRPYFPGKDLNVKVPHLYDEILHLDKMSVPSIGEVIALRTQSSYDAFARDRSGRLAEFEQPNLTQVFNKITQG